MGISNFFGNFAPKIYHPLSMKKILLSLLALLLSFGGSAFAQKKVLYGIGFYNVENLFDTQHDPGKNDFEFLPTGSYGWTEQKYQAKLKNMSQVLSEMCTEVGKAKNPVGAAVIGLSEVENRRVLEDLIKQPSLAPRGYQIVHIDGPDRRGVDCAFLFNPKAFKMERALLVPYVYRTTDQPNVDLGCYLDQNKRVQAYPHENGRLIGDTTHITRGFLTISGWLGGERFHFIINHWPSRGAESPARERAGYQVRRLKEMLLQQDPSAHIVVMGDLNDDPGDKSIVGQEALAAKTKMSETGATDLFNPWYDVLYNKGNGTLLYNGKWNLFDQIMFTGSLLNTPKNKLHYYTHAIFTRDYLFQTEGRYKGSPKRTTAGGTWLNGYSDHLPTQVFLIKEIK